MPRPKGSKNKAKISLTNAEGVAYVFLNGNDEINVSWENTDVTAETMEKLRGNEEAESLQINLSNLIFSEDDPIISVLDTEENDQDEIAARLRQMCERPEVAFFDQMKNYLIDSCFGCYVGSIGLSSTQDGFIELTEFRDLPSASFTRVPFSVNDTYGHAALFPGIIRDKEGKIHYWQIQEDGEPKELKNCFHLKPPGRDFDLCGKPLFYSLVPVFNRANFAWIALMQTVNRVGAPSIFIRVTNPTQKDMELAKKILQNYSKNNQFTIPANFEIIEIGKGASDISLKAIEIINNKLTGHFSPSKFVSTDGNLIGGSDEAKAQLLGAFIMGFRQTIADRFTPILQRILEYNGYLDYKVKISFPKFEFKNSVLDLEKAKDAADRKVISRNEYRLKAGWEPATEEDLDEIYDEWKSAVPIIPTGEEPLIGSETNSSESPTEPENETVTDGDALNQNEEDKKTGLKINQNLDAYEGTIKNTSKNINDGWDELVNKFTVYLKKKVKT
jgi:hypothetical protein